MKAAVLGVGARGSAWAARLALMGCDVALFDIDTGALARAMGCLETARPLLAGVYDAPLPPEGRITQVHTIPEAVDQADWIVEALPARLPLKQKVLQVAQSHSDAVIAGAGGVSVADLQGCASAPKRIIVAAGQAPEWLLPLVELGIGPRTSAETARVARAQIEAFGMIAVESEGLAARLCAAFQPGDPLHRQIMQLGLGPSLMAGDDHRLMVALVRTLRSSYRAETAPLRRFEAARGLPAITKGPIVTLEMAVPADWTDYNGHMTEAKYLEAFGFATDRFMATIGMDAAYIASGLSLFTSETHIRHLSEAHVGTPFRMETRVLVGEGKVLSLWHEMRAGDTLLATAENLMIHVDLTTRKACVPREDVAKTLSKLAKAHAKLPAPDGAGRYVGQR